MSIPIWRCVARTTLTGIYRGRRTKRGKWNSLATDDAFALFSSFVLPSLLSFLDSLYSTPFFHLLSGFLPLSLSRACSLLSEPFSLRRCLLLCWPDGRTDADAGLPIDLAGAGWATPETSSGTRFECQQQQLRSLHFCHKKDTWLNCSTIRFIFTVALHSRL